MLLTRHGPVDRLAIIRAVSDEAGDLVVDLLEQTWSFTDVVCIIPGQHICDCFPGVHIDREMQLAPGSAMVAVSLFVPCAVSKEFQPRGAATGCMAHAIIFGRRVVNSPLRQLSVMSSVMRRLGLSKRSTLPTKASVCRRARRNAVGDIGTVSIARPG
jgi:hypothetical protein